MNERGDVISGFDKAACELVFTDELHTTIKWNGADFANLKGKNICLRFALGKARLFTSQIKTVYVPDTVHCVVFAIRLR